MILKTICKYFLGILLGLPIFILFLACPALETTKIILFTRSNEELPLHLALEIPYLVLAAFGPFLLIVLIIANCCFGPTISKYGLQKILMWLLLLWVIIAVLYTHYTWDEMGYTPFFCPENFDYVTAEIRIACQIRAANLISIWSFLVLSILWVQFIYAGWIDENLNICYKLVHEA